MAADPSSVPGIDVAALRSWLVGPGGQDIAGSIRARLLPGGRSNISALVEDEAGARWVVRRPPLGHVMPSAHDMGREFRVLTGLNRAGLPAPQALAMCEDDQVLGAPFVLMSFVDGRSIDTQAKAEALGAHQASEASAALIDTLAGIHLADVEAAGLRQLGKPEGYLGRQASRWAKQWELTRTRPLAEVDELRERLQPAIESVPDGLPWSLVHGDYRLDNTILAHDRSQVIAVVDWEMSTLGDPVADLAVALVYWSQAGDRLREQVPVAEHITDQAGFWTRAQLVERYAERTGLALDHLDACTALAAFKLAVIMESIRYRALEGQQLGAAADQAEAMGQATEALARLGLAVLEAGTLDGLHS